MEASINKYDKSIPLDLHVWSDNTQLLQLSTDIWLTLYPDSPHDKGKRNTTKFIHLRLVLVNLLKSYRIDPEQYIGYSRNKKSYVKRCKYNDLHISYKPMIDIIGLLIEHGYIEHKMGAHILHKCSRIKPTDRLIDLFDKHDDIPLTEIYRVDEEVIVLRGPKDEKTKKSARLEHNDDAFIEPFKQKLLAHNSVLKDADITLDEVSLEEPFTKKVDYTKKKVRRIFNDGTWERGGRFYGGWWQHIESKHRKHIKINGKPTTEVDYKGFHITLLYSIRGINYSQIYKDDPYSIVGYDNDSIHRKFFKNLLLTILNCKNEASAIKSMKTKVYKKDLLLPSDINIRTGINAAIEAFKTKHKDISDYFFNYAGIGLQRIESNVAEYVIDTFTKQSIPVLCIHDSFITSHEHQSILIDTLHDAFSYELNVDYKVELDIEH